MDLKYVLLVTTLLPLSSQAVEVNKKDWINAMSTALPTALCNSNQYFRKCFNVSAQECEETMSSAARICLSKSEKHIPNTLIQPEDGTHWGAIVGKCVGEAYELTLITKRHNNATCNNISNWQ